MHRQFQAARLPAADACALAQVERIVDAFLPAPSPLAADLESKLADVQIEMDGLRDELNLLRRRDETLNFSMQRLDDELRLAARLQQDFLPKTLPRLGNIQFHTLYRPAGYVSGDLYDVMRLDEAHIGFYIADAVGHGMPAALLTMFIKHALVTKEITAGGYRLVKPSVALGRLNEAMIEQDLSNATFATALYGMVNIHTLELTMSCAGHPPPALLPQNGPMSNVVAEGGLLGIFPGELYTDYTFRLNPGDRLILYTDGIEVAFCEDAATGDPNRWRDEILSCRSRDSASMLQEFADRTDRACGSLAPKDDLTVVVMEIER